MEKRIRTYSDDEALVNERREHIVRCAAKLFAKHGYQRSNMQQVVKACNMSKGALYHYIGSKEDIFYLAVNRSSSFQVKDLAPLSRNIQHLSPADALRESIKVFLQMVDANQDEAIFVIRTAGELPRDGRKILFDVHDVNVAFFEETLRRGIEEGAFKIETPKMVAHHINHLCYAWAERRWFLGKHYTLEEYTRQLTDFILKGIGAALSPVAAGREEEDKHTSTVPKSTQQ